MERTEKQIKEIIKQIELVWIENKHLRLGQMLENVKLKKGKDLFFLEDKDLVTLMNDVHS
jgi:hypothetical protein